MIETWRNNKCDLKAIQLLTSPAVYLDHWAVRRLSEDSEKAGRFVKALKTHGGTLALSWVNLLEFTKLRDREQARKAEAFIEANLPRVFFLEADPLVVIGGENNLLRGGPSGPPHADQDLLKQFVLWKRPSPEQLTASGFFQVVQGSGLEQHLEEMADTAINRIESMRHELDTDPEFRSMLRAPATGPNIQRGTRIILRELLRTFLIELGMKVTRNHVIDLFHAVVPLAYCDLVLLDKHWETQVNRLRRRLEAADLSIPLARAFSEKANGVGHFIVELESWSASGRVASREPWPAD